MRLRNDGNIEYVANRPRVLQLTPVIQAAAYSTNDVLFITEEIKAIDPNAGPDSNGNGTLPAFPRPGGGLEIVDILVVDKAAQDPGLHLFFLKTNVSIGAIKTTEALSDANSSELITMPIVLATDYLTLTNVSVANIRNQKRIIYADADSDQLFLGGQLTTTDTFGSTSDIRIVVKCRAF